MAVDWPAGVPYRILREGVGYDPGETVARSPTASGLARHRSEFTAAPDGFSGNIRMSEAEMVSFFAWRRNTLKGGTFNWLGHPWAATVEARFVAGSQRPPTLDPKAPKWLVPVVIEILP